MIALILALIMYIPMAAAVTIALIIYYCIKY